MKVELPNHQISFYLSTDIHYITQFDIFFSLNQHLYIYLVSLYLYVVSTMNVQKLTQITKTEKGEKEGERAGEREG